LLKLRGTNYSTLVENEMNELSLEKQNMTNQDAFSWSNFIKITYLRRELIGNK
jgi:hypothetical protein